MVARRLLVLVIEDDDDLRALEAACLEEANYRVATAREGREALDRIAAEMPDVILLDMRMPGMDGWAFAQEFRKRHNHETPIVVVTAAANGRTRATEIGADGFLGKPFEVAELLRVAAHQAGKKPPPRVPS